jgi:membrane protein implicated in regulation of membrane protease activity
MKLKHDLILITVTLGFGLLVTACASDVSFVSANDPVIGICQQPAVLNITTAQNAIDNANNNAGMMDGSDTGQQMTQAQVNQIEADAKVYSADAVQLNDSHPALANDFRTESSLFFGAIAQGNGLTTNTVAVAVDRYAGDITGTCGSFRVGTAPHQNKPGPGIWDWHLFWLAFGGYLLMIPVASVLIAFSEREKPRNLRLSAGKIFWISTIWWVALIVLAARIYRQVLESVKTTPDERKDDRIAILTKDIKRLEAGLKMKGSKDG